MIDGFTAARIDGLPEHLIEIRLTQTEGYESEEPANLTLIFAIGPADPNALSYLIPRSVFEREQAVHVGALSPADENLLYAMYDVLEVMNADEIVVFLCEDDATLQHAIEIVLSPPLVD